MEEQTQLKDVKGILRRGKKSFAIVSLSIFLLGVIIAFVLPPIYLSQSTILIENQLIPNEYVHSSITGFVEQRLQVITQRVMSRTKLVEIIDQFSLYPDMQDKYTTEEIVEEMREDISLETRSAEVIDTRTGRPTAATIAFSLSYEGEIPSTVNKVANMLSSIYLEQNLQTREKQASDTTAFLQKERDELKAQIGEIQDKLGEFKKTHAGALPEFSAINLQTIARFERDIDQTDMQIRSLRERLIYLKGQISDIDPLKPIMTEDGKAIMNPEERLKYLRLELITKKSTFSEKHPDIKKLKNEIQELESQTGTTDDSVEKIRRLKDLQGQFAALKGKLGPKHPDVVKMSKEVELLSKEVDKLRTEKTTAEVSEDQPDNPAYINLKTQITTTEMEIKTSLQQKNDIKQKIASNMAMIEKAPLVEKGYNDLMHDYENSRFKYNEVMNKLMEAKIAQGMEEAQQGERFTIIDPAQLPEKPFKPNRIAIIVIGFVLALGAGVGIAAVKEATDSSVKSEEILNSITGVPVFSTISMIETEQELATKKKKRLIWIASAIAAVILALIIIHFFVMPLDIAWIKVQRRLHIL